MTRSVNPKDLGYRMPAEFEPQEGVWLAWPYVEEIWYGNHAEVERTFGRFVAELAQSERVFLIVENDATIQRAVDVLVAAGADTVSIDFHKIPTNDIWMRDNGPIFLVNPEGRSLIVDWKFNGWGEKFGPYDRDDIVPQHIAKLRDLECLEPGIILEGGSVDVDGEGTLLTSRQCLLNPNRNGNQSEADLEPYLKSYFGVEKVIWLNRGLVEDHTDGHVDNLARYVAPGHVVAVSTQDQSHPDYASVQENLEILKASRDARGRELRITPLPLPHPMEICGERVSPSHANFVIGNDVVIVPTYGIPEDDVALGVLASCFPTRRVVGLEASQILSGGGSLHCISQQEPRTK